MVSFQKCVWLFVFTGSALIAQAQKVKKETDVVFEYGKIPSEDIAMKVYAPDSSAEAVVLTKKFKSDIEVTTYSGIQLIIRKFRRVKLFKKTAFDSEGTVTIRFDAKNTHERFNFMKAAVVQPDGTRQELTKKDFVEEKTSDKYYTKKFTFPNLTVGCIIEYDYERVLGDFTVLPEYYFQEDIPVRHSEMWQYVPQYFDYVYLTKGRIKIKDETLPEQFNNGYTSVVKKFYADTVPALKAEAFITTMDDYLSQISTQLSHINYPDGHKEDYLTTWKKVAETFLKSDRVGEQFNSKSKFGKIWDVVKPQLVSAETEDQKIQIIYDYLNENMNWADDYFSFTCSESLNNAFEKKKANSGELNMMMLACLKEAGIKAAPMLLSTRENGKPTTIYPIRSQFNHLACYIERGEKSTLVDVGNVLRPLGLPRTASLNDQGWILDAEFPRWIAITSPQSTEGLLANFKLDAEGTLKGTFNSSYRGYAALTARTEETDKQNHDNLKATLAKQYPDIKIDSISLENLKKVNAPFKRNVYCTIPNATTVSGDIIYVKPTLKNDFDENPFKQPKREYPVEFPYPFKDQFVLNLTIPQGYSVDEIPKSIIVNLPNDGGSFRYNSAVTNNVVQLAVKIQINQLVFQPEEYSNIKNFFQQIADKSSEQIVLKKKTN